MKQDEGLVTYLTNIILRPHREVYSIEKLGPQKIVVKSNEKSISVLQSMSKNEKHLPKEMQQNYCELIEVNRREVTVRSEGRSVQASVYEPQLTTGSKKPVQPLSPNPKQSFHCQPSHLSYQNCVIFLHANSGSRIQGTQYAKHVLQYRTLCVSFDYTGSGVSEGQYTTMGVNEARDLSAVLNYVRERYGVRRFGLWGRSMGAVTGIYYLLTHYKQDLPHLRITSCVIDSPFSSLQRLILEIASKKSTLPQFVFQPFLKIIETEIITKIGINIFQQLNLLQKITSLSPQQKKLLDSVSFLGLASKDDKMISHEHCEELCQLLIPSDVRNSDLIDDKHLIVQNVADKHLMMLVGFKKEVNMRGDFIEIEGDHNKPRANEVKEKIAFFIEDSFMSYKDQWEETQQSQQQNNPMTESSPTFPPTMSFSKTGLSIKTKLAFSKAAQNNGIKTRKNSTTMQPTPHDPIPDSNPPNNGSFPEQNYNYNLINLKDIKASLGVGRKSLSKERESVRNSLTKGLGGRVGERREKRERRGDDRNNSNGNNDNSIGGNGNGIGNSNSGINSNSGNVGHGAGNISGNNNKSGGTYGYKGLNIVSKQYNRDSLTSNPTSSQQPHPKNPSQTLQNSKHSHPQQQPKPKFPLSQSTFASLIKNRTNQAMNKTTQNDNSVDVKQRSQQRSQSEHDSSVNNSISRDSGEKEEEARQQKPPSSSQQVVMVTALNLSQNNIASHNAPTHYHPNLTQRLPRAGDKYFQSVPSQRNTRNALSQTYVHPKKLQQSPTITTSPFNLSIDNGSNNNNMSFEFQMKGSLLEESFRKKEMSREVVEAMDLEGKKEAPKTPQVKISISEFKNSNNYSRQEVEARTNGSTSNSTSISKKFQTLLKKDPTLPPNNNDPTQPSTRWSSITNQLTKGQQSTYSDQRLSTKNSFQFRKRQPAQTNSIHNSNMSHDESFDNMKRSQDQQDFVSHQQQHQQQTSPSQFHRQPIPLQQSTLPMPKPQNVSSSFTSSQPNPISIKQMMINSGHKGLTQSSTFNHNNNMYVNPVYQAQFQQQQYVYQSSQGQCYHQGQGGLGGQGGQGFAVSYENKPGSSNAYYSGSSSGQQQIHQQIQSQQQQLQQQQQNNGFLNMNMNQVRSMKTSQDPYPNDPSYTYNPNTIPNPTIPKPPILTTLPQSNIFFQSNRNTSQSVTYSPNPSLTNNNGWYGTGMQQGKQPAKQPIEYKKKITRLLD